MALVDARRGPAEAPQRADNHFCVLVAVKGRRRADDAKVDVALVVKDGAAAGATPHELDRRGCRGGEAREVGLDPRVLVAPKDDAGRVGVEHEYGGVGGRVLQEVMLDGEVEQRIAGAGEVDLRLVGGIDGGVGREEVVVSRQAAG